VGCRKLVASAILEQRSLLLTVANGGKNVYGAAVANVNKPDERIRLPLEHRLRSILQSPAYDYITDSLEIITRTIKAAVQAAKVHESGDAKKSDRDKLDSDVKGLTAYVTPGARTGQTKYVREFVTSKMWESTLTSFARKSGCCAVDCLHGILAVDGMQDLEGATKAYKVAVRVCDCDCDCVCFTHTQTLHHTQRHGAMAFLTTLEQQGTAGVLQTVPQTFMVCVCVCGVVHLTYAVSHSHSQPAFEESTHTLTHTHTAARSSKLWRRSRRCWC
jgi:hypothetical protein